MNIYQMALQKAYNEHDIHKKLSYTQDLIALAPNEKLALNHSQEAAQIRRTMNHMAYEMKKLKKSV